MFTRPEMKAERVSYDVMTPSAARGVLEAIYWKPQIRWVIDAIHVLKPVRWMNIRRNEVGSKASYSNAKTAMKKGKGNLGMIVEEERQQRASLLLRDVGYVIEAHFEMLDASEKEQKHFAMFSRRARQGQYFHHPYLGCREFPAHFKLIEGDEPLPECELPENERDKDFGFMLYDMDYQPDKKGAVIDGHTGKRLNPQPQFFRAVMKDGIINLRDVQRQVVA
ncbi:MAG: type I-C CRISPR-associated protein Cas5 [Phycisphaeraceae bacterium]|nr:type I-C CRISPR-associated protein Cas5 [Phycisphaeraceae bacterium]